MNSIATTETEQTSARKKDCLYLSAVLAAPIADAEKKVSLRQSWLPLTDRGFDMKGPAGFRVPGVIPALGDRTFPRVAPQIDAYAAKRNWTIQPVLYFYQPKVLVEMLEAARAIAELEVSGTDTAAKEIGIGDMVIQQRALPLDERFQFDTTIQSETVGPCGKLVDLCLEVLKEAQLEPSYFDSDKPRLTLGRMLQDYPFLVHHIFNAYPKLHVLKHKGRISGREETVIHIRYRPEDASDINSRRFMRSNIPNVIA